MPRSGLSAQLGFAQETTYGTPVTVTRFVPLVSESLAREIERLESAGIIAGARLVRSQQWSAGNQNVGGDLGLELYDRSIGLLFKHMFGAVSSTGAGPYTHTFTPGSLEGLGLTVQVGRPDVAGTVQPFTYAGLKVASWELGLSAGEIATLGLSVVGKSETTGIALASASYATSIAPMTFVGAAVTVSGSSSRVRSLSLAGDNGLDVDRYFIGDTQRDEPLETQLREYTGELDTEFMGLTDYNRFVNGTESTLVIALAKGSSTCTITCNVRYDGQTPAVDGPGIIGQTLPFKAIATTNDAAGITAVLVNSDSQP